MVLAIAAVTALAWWDEQREADAALATSRREQTVVASSLAASLRAHLAAIERDAVLIGEHAGAGRSRDPTRPPSSRGRTAPAHDSDGPVARASERPLADGRHVDLGVAAARSPRAQISGSSEPVS